MTDVIRVDGGHVFRTPNAWTPTPGLQWPRPIEEVAAERSIFSETLDWSRANATPLVRQMLNAVYVVMGLYRPPSGMHLVVDVRVQRLMRGMFASIPGWHGDAVPRASYHDQPDLHGVDPAVRHWLVHVATGDVGGTEFLDEPCAIEIDHSEAVWRQAHLGVEEKGPRTREARRGEIVEFGQDALHRCVPTRERGWRILARVATMPTPPLRGRFADQQQVYVLSEANGW